MSDDAAPLSLALAGSGELARRAAAAPGLLGGSCEVCPRGCPVNRLDEQRGLCAIGRQAVVASYFPHFGGEDCLRGWRGSGTIFFSGCNLRCVFCQNYDISWQVRGERASPERLAEMMLELQALGCHNINWVTPEHVVPQIMEAVPLALAAVEAAWELRAAPRRAERGRGPDVAAGVRVAAVSERPAPRGGPGRRRPRASGR